jgi:hypothetical protein
MDWPWTFKILLINLNDIIIRLSFYGMKFSWLN